MKADDPGPIGNERLTSSTGLVLLVLLAIETLTTLALRTYLNVHLFLGMLLLPPIVLKLASTGWRVARGFIDAHRRGFRRKQRLPRIPWFSPLATRKSPSHSSSRS